VQGTKQRVIAEYQRTGRLDLACKGAQIHHSQHFRWMESEPEYQAAFAEAKESRVIRPPRGSAEWRLNERMPWPADYLRPPIEERGLMQSTLSNPHITGRITRGSGKDRE